MRYLTVLLVLLLFSSFSANCQFVWARQVDRYPHTFSTPKNGAILDNAGNSYYAGSFEESVSFGSGSASIPGTLFLTKYDPAGRLKWSTTTSGTGSTIFRSLIEDHSGHLYILGTYKGTVGFDTIVVGPGSIPRPFIAKYDTSGSLVWVKPFYQFNLLNDGGISSIACDGQDNLYLTVGVNTTVYVDSILLDGTIGRQFIVRMSPAGTAEWVKQINGTGLIRESILAVDNENNIIFGTSLEGLNVSIDFDGHVHTNPSNTFRSIVIAKFDVSGNYKWSKRIGNYSENYLWGVNCDGSNNVYINGLLTYPSGATENVIGRLSPQGQQQWMYPARSNNYIVFRDIALSGTRLYGCITFRDSFVYKNVAIYLPGENSLLAQMDILTGDIIWETPVPALSSGLDVGPNGLVLLNGSAADNIELASGQLHREDYPFDFLTLYRDSTALPNLTNSISGSIYHDANVNCSRDSEVGLAGFSIIAEPGPYYAVADSQGHYIVRVDTGQFHISVVQNLNSSYLDSLNCAANGYDVTLDTPNQHMINLDFAFSRTPCYFLRVRVKKHNGLLPNGMYFITYTICNEGSDTAHDVVLRIKYPGEYIAFDTTFLPGYSYSNADSTLTLPIHDLSPNSCQEVFIQNSNSISGNGMYSKQYFWHTLTPFNICFLADTSYNTGWRYDEFAEGVPSTPASNRRIIYPNPVERFANVRMVDKDDLIELFDMKGHVVFQTRADVHKELKLDFEGYPSGLFFLFIQDKNTRQGYKILKQ